MNINILRALTYKGLLLIAALLLMVFALAACGETTGEPGAEEGVEAPTTP